MKITVLPYSADVSFSVHYKEPMLAISQEESRIPIIRNILRNFEVHLDQLAFDGKSLSGNFISFTKQYGPSLLGVHFGLEETSANFWRVDREEQVVDSFGKLFTILDEIPIASMRINMSNHFQVKGEVNSFLGSLNPNIPNDFKEFLSGRGVFFHLKFPELGLSSYLTVVNSLLVSNGLFLGAENQLSPVAGTLVDSLASVFEKLGFIMNSLGITVEKEV